MNANPFTPIVLLDARSDGHLVFARGHKHYHAVAAQGGVIHLVTLESLRGMRPIEHKGKPYPPKRAASIWLNHSNRAITKKAKSILRAFVARNREAA